MKHLDVKKNIKWTSNTFCLQNAAWGLSRQRSIQTSVCKPAIVSLGKDPHE